VARWGRVEQLWRALSLLLLVLAPSAQAAEARIAIIIDDMGNGLREGRRALALPGAVTYSFLPQTPHAVTLAQAAHAAGREVMLHLPLESEDHRRLGPGGITAGMSSAERDAILAEDLAAIPYVSGVNNHMGSRLTAEQGAMEWLMQRLQERGNLYFVDSRTSSHSVAYHTAFTRGLPALQRDVFLDHRPTHAFISRQFEQLLREARRWGSALAIGHPYPETLGFLEQALPQLAEQGVELVPVSTLIADQENRRTELWQASWSPSPPVAKSSKP